MLILSKPKREFVRKMLNLMPSLRSLNFRETETHFELIRDYFLFGIRVPWTWTCVQSNLGCPPGDFLRLLPIVSCCSSDFLQVDIHGYFPQHIKNRTQFGSIRLSNFYMVEYCENFKMAFSKILDFLRGLKIHSKAPTSY